MRYIKNTGKIFLVTGFCLLYKTSVFASNTKQMINQVLAKYGISAGGKEVCGHDKEPFYDTNTGKVRCYNNNNYFENNCWDASSRLCKECPFGKVVSKIDFTTCRQIVCPEGYELIEVKDETCPEGFEYKWVDSCNENFDSYNEIQATNNYSTQPINCKDIN